MTTHPETHQYDLEPCLDPTPTAMDFPGGFISKESSCNAGDPGSIPGSGRSSGGGYGNPLQYSCLENPMDRGSWQVTVNRVTKSLTRLKRLSMHAHNTVQKDFHEVTHLAKLTASHLFFGPNLNVPSMYICPFFMLSFT